MDKKNCMKEAVALFILNISIFWHKMRVKRVVLQWKNKICYKLQAAVYCKHENLKILDNLIK